MSRKKKKTEENLNKKTQQTRKQITKKNTKKYKNQINTKQKANKLNEQKKKQEMQDEKWNKQTNINSKIKKNEAALKRERTVGRREGRGSGWGGGQHNKSLGGRVNKERSSLRSLSR